MLSAKGIGICAGIFWAIWVGWCVFVALIGIGNTPFNFVDQMYFGWLTPTIAGLILGVVLGFIDGLICGVIFVLIYNAISKKKA